MTLTNLVETIALGAFMAVLALPIGNSAYLGMERDAKSIWYFVLATKGLILMATNIQPRIPACHLSLVRCLIYIAVVGDELLWLNSHVQLTPSPGHFERVGKAECTSLHIHPI